MLAWIALWGWSTGPWQRYIAHGDWMSLGPASVLCRAIPGGDVLVPAALHTLGWLLMIVAMMLPTTLPLINQFGRMIGSRADGPALMRRVIFGYFVVWTAFGLMIHVLDWGLHLVAADIPWVGAHGWVVGAAMIALAGAFQFSALKYRCLEQCRTPISFITSHWRGQSPRREAWSLGIAHGAFCVGCCWALMMLMFVVGTASVGWMLMLGALMAVEKNVSWGRRLSAPLGVGLLVIAGSIVFVELS